MNRKNQLPPPRKRARTLEPPTPRRPYGRPRLVKKRPVSSATLFTGAGPDSGGLIGSG